MDNLVFETHFQQWWAGRSYIRSTGNILTYFFCIKGLQTAKKITLTMKYLLILHSFNSLHLVFFTQNYLHCLVLVFYSLRNSFNLTTFYHATHDLLLLSVNLRMCLKMFAQITLVFAHKKKTHYTWAPKMIWALNLKYGSTLFLYHSICKSIFIYC